MVNEEKWKDLVSHLGDAVYEVVDTYLDDSPQRIAEMRRCLDSGDFATVERLAHSIKSSSGIFGAQQMVRACQELEASAFQHGEDCDTRLRSVERAYDELAEDLRRRTGE